MITISKANYIPYKPILEIENYTQAKRPKVGAIDRLPLLSSSVTSQLPLRAKGAQPLAVQDLSEIVEEGQNIIKNLDGLNQNTSPSNSDIKGLLSQINTFLKNLLNELGKQVTLDEIVDIVNKVAPSTVMIHGNGVRGSGVIFRDNNGKRYILTNAHVIEGIDNKDNSLEELDLEDEDIELLKNKIEITRLKPRQEGIYHITLYNGSDFKKSVEFDTHLFISRDGTKAISSPNEHDLALLEIPDNVQLPKDIGVEMRDTTKDPLKAGEPLIAIGNPLGEKDSISFGIASNIDRGSDININRHIQTDAAINPGNSGGGLFDLKGRLVGINTWAFMGANNIAGSIRIDYVKMVLESWGISVNTVA